MFGGGGDHAASGEETVETAAGAEIDDCFGGSDVGEGEWVAAG